MRSDITRLTCMLLTFLFLSACAADSATERLRLPTEAEVEQYNAVVPPAEQIVCLEETELGSRFKRRNCYLRGDLETRGNQGQAVVDAMRQDGLIQNPVFRSR